MIDLNGISEMVIESLREYYGRSDEHLKVDYDNATVIFLYDEKDNVQFKISIEEIER